MHKGVFDEVAQFVEVLIVLALNLSILFWGNDDVGFVCLGRSNDLIGVVATISQQVFGVEAFGQRASLSAISDGTCCNNDSHRHTMRIHGQMYFCVKPPFVRPMSWLPPRAPVPCA